MKRKKEISNQSVSQTSILLNKKFKIVLFLIVSIIAISYFSNLMSIIKVLVSKEIMLIIAFAFQYAVKS